ncbi:NACHT domain protein [Apiospora marii]|uniref:NACHT domain protein n=1 Tax=Apiospora marii TaxID=335849 RepID=A0ABR1S4U3_9PEZI
MAPPIVSPTARGTISDAFKKLEATIVAGDMQDLKEMKTIEQVREAVLKIESQLAARGKLRNLRRLLPLFQGLEHYAKVVDVLCNGTPFLPWVWAPITLILRVSSDHLEAFDHILSSYAKIADSLKRFGVLDKRFSRNQSFQETAAVFYADILEFHKHAYQFVTRSCRNSPLAEENTEKLQRSEEEQGIKQYNSIVAWLKIDESDQLTIFDMHLEESTRYNADTCGWVLSNPKMQLSLQRQPSIPLLWVQGAAGTGKSVLSSAIVNYMKSAGSLVISHFCNYAYPSSIKYDLILRSLLLQLVREDADLVAHVYENYILAKKVAGALLMERLLQFLLSNISKAPQQTSYVWIILDGVDECDLVTQNKLFRLINQVTSRNFGPDAMIVKALVFCRFSADASAKLSKKQSISLAEEKEHMDLAIRNYTRERLKGLSDKFEVMHLTDADIQELEDAITEKADGMFLYARLVLDYLWTEVFIRKDELKMSVHELPAKLSEFKIVTQILIKLMDKRSVDRVKCALGWIAFSQRPLKKIELLSALAFSLGDVSVENIAPQYLLDMCATLIEERPDTRVGFVHVSVKEFLRSSSSNLILDEKESMLQHGIATVTCLLAAVESFTEGVPDDPVLVRIIRGLYGFHIYAKEHWTDYLLAFVPSNENPGSPASILFELACDLAERLNQLSSNAGHLLGKMDDLFAEEEPTPKRLADERIGKLGSPLLQNVVDGCLKARSLEQLELKLKQMESRGRPIDDTAPSAVPLPQEGVSLILERYQTAVRYLLNRAVYVGVPAADLDFFKRQFRDVAYTCRVRRCPRAISGFENQAQCSEHEILHVRSLPCPYPGCQSPAFMSSKNLKRHINKEHAEPHPRRKIRKVGILQPRANSNRQHDHIRTSPGNARITQAQQQSGLAPVPLPIRNNINTEKSTSDFSSDIGRLKSAVLEAGFAGIEDLDGIPIFNTSQLNALGRELRSVYEKCLIQSLTAGQTAKLGDIFSIASRQQDPMGALITGIRRSLSSSDPTSAMKFATLMFSATLEPDDFKFRTLMEIMDLNMNYRIIGADSPSVGAPIKQPEGLLTRQEFQIGNRSSDAIPKQSPTPQLTKVPGPIFSDILSDDDISDEDIEQDANMALSSPWDPVRNRHLPSQDIPDWSAIFKEGLEDLPQDVKMETHEIVDRRWLEVSTQFGEQCTAEMFKQVINEARNEAFIKMKLVAQARDQTFGTELPQSPSQQGVTVGGFSISDDMNQQSKEPHAAPSGFSETQEPDYNVVPDHIKAHVEQLTFYAYPYQDQRTQNEKIESARRGYERALVAMDGATKKMQEIKTKLKENSAATVWVAGFDLKQMMDEYHESERDHAFWSESLHGIRSEQERIKALHGERLSRRK